MELQNQPSGLYKFMFTYSDATIGMNCFKYELISQFKK